MVKTLKGGYILLMDEMQLRRMAGANPASGA